VGADRRGESGDVSMEEEDLYGDEGEAEEWEGEAQHAGGAASRMRMPPPVSRESVEDAHSSSGAY